MQRPTWRILFVMAACATAMSSLRVLAGQVPADLLRLVGRDVGLCVEITQARERRLAFAQSELWSRFRQSPFFEDWRKSRGYQKFADARRML
ncbi:MAG TPA: hypothetical protein VHB77_11870, partial [Planctomycetaceae bacterium]|nr:hypothetical protein [Planctomycetaceae bacterium]